MTHYVYWTDVSGKTISRARLDGTDSEVIVQRLGSPEGVAVDWVSKNIYWADSGIDKIEVSRLDGTNMKTLVSEGLVNPRGIAVDPVRGVMFWADWNREAPKIEKANMDGTDRRALVTEGLGLPNGLALDYELMQVCWADAGTHKVECVNYEGRSQRTITASVNYPFGLAYFNSILYWTDWERKTLPNHSKMIGEFANEDLTLPLGANGHMYGIAAVRSSCPSGSNPCAYNNGGCRYLCLPSSKGGRTCACPDDISPDECNRVALL
jgi:nidogen (entactin)